MLTGTYPRNVLVVDEKLVLLLPNGPPNHDLAGILLQNTAFHSMKLQAHAALILTGMRPSLLSKIIST